MENTDTEDSTAMYITHVCVYSEIVDWEEGDFVSVKFDIKWLLLKILALQDR